MTDPDLPPASEEVRTGSDEIVEPDIAVDDDLLRLAGQVLIRAGYTTIPPGSAIPAILAENADNVVAVTATITVEDTVRAEPILSKLLTAQMGAKSLDGKRWDGYVVLLTSQAAPEATAEPLFGIAYNLRHVRRLVKVGVDSTLAGVQRAIRPVLPLPKPPAADELTDPLTLLRDRLLQRGLDAAAVDASIARFHPEAQRPEPSDAEVEDEERTNG
jgi:hypothetical protein